MVQIEKYELNVNASKKNRKRVHKLQDSSKHTTTQVNSKNDDLNGEVHVIDKKYDEINGKGYFDWFVALPVGFGYCISLSYILPFLTQIPTILCSQDGMNWNKCSTSDICNVESSPMYKLDELSSYTITNWITDRGLLCISNFDRALFGSIYMAGFAFGALAILRLGDIFGRKPILIISTASSIIVYFILCFVKDTKIIYVLLFIDGAMRLTKGSLAYIVTLELIPKNKRSKFSSIITSVGGCTSLFTVGLIYIFKDALITLSILTVISLVQFLFVLICPESPKFLYSINKIKEVNQSLKFIAKVNCSDHQEVTLDEDDTNSKSKDSNNLLSFFEALKNRTYRINILIMSFIYCVTFMCYYAIGFYVGNFPGNLFINAFALMVSDIVGSGLCTLWINTFGFKHGFSVMYIIVVISTVMYYLFGGTIFISYACVFMMRFGLTMAVSLSLFACSQIFETKIQARSFAFCNFLGKLTSILGPLIVTLAPNPLLIIAVLSICVSVVCQFLEKESNSKIIINKN